MPFEWISRGILHPLPDKNIHEDKFVKIIRGLLINPTIIPIDIQIAHTIYVRMRRLIKIRKQEKNPRAEVRF